MKSKLLYLIFSTIISFSFANTIYSQPPFNETCWDETPAYDVDCDVYDAYSYVTAGVGPFIIIPNIGFGYRERHANLGWDSALSFSTIGYMHQLSAHVVGHYYLSPSRQNSPYIGLGLMGSCVFGNHKMENWGTLSLDFVFGKEFVRTDDSRHFLEMHVGMPTLWIESKHPTSIYFPLMYIKYGFSF